MVVESTVNDWTSPANDSQEHLNIDKTDKVVMSNVLTVFRISDFWPDTITEFTEITPFWAGRNAMVSNVFKAVLLRVQIVTDSASRSIW